MTKTTRDILGGLAVSLAIVAACMGCGVVLALLNGGEPTVGPSPVPGQIYPVQTPSVAPTIADLVRTPIPVATTPAAPVRAPEPYYRSCAEVRAAGKAPIQRGEPGYRPGLDRDGDGIACDT